MHGRVRVFIACPLDGFIAGENDDLSFLPAPDPAGSDAGHGAFMKGVGCILMGRETFVSATPLHAGMVQLCYRLGPSPEVPA